MTQDELILEALTYWRDACANDPEKVEQIDSVIQSFQKPPLREWIVLEARSRGLSQKPRLKAVHPPASLNEEWHSGRLIRAADELSAIVEYCNFIGTPVSSFDVVVESPIKSPVAIANPETAGGMLGFSDRRGGRDR